jgi:hypothetical protein
MAYILTRISTPDYDTWKESFDKDVPGVRTSSKGWQVFRSVENLNEVFIIIKVEFDSTDEANAGRDRLIASGVLDRFEDKHGPTVVEDAETVSR